VVNPALKVLLDHLGMLRLVFGWETSDYSLCFVAYAPARAIVAFLNGLDPESLTGAVVEVQSGDEIGLAGRVRLGSVGKPHSKITVYQRVNGPPDTTLSQMLAEGRQDEN
jgi:hypothetical protein